MKKILIISYYWPPAGGSGVQRWLYFGKFLKEFGHDVTILTVDPTYASYSRLDESLVEQVKEVKKFTTKSFEVTKLYSRLVSKDSRSGIPAGSIENKNSIVQRAARFIRGNFFVPDARVGWVKYAIQKGRELLKENNFELIITTGPPHSTHLIGQKLKQKFKVTWIADFRDPWTEIYYNKLFYQLPHIKRKDARLEKMIIDNADYITTIGNNMSKLLQSKTNHPSKVRYFYNGFDEQLLKNAPEVETATFDIVFTGLLSKNQNYALLLQTLKAFEESAMENQIQLIFAGNIDKEIIQAFEKNLAKIKVIYHGYVSHQKAIELIKNATLLTTILPNTENSEIIISGKIMEYLSTGNPILLFGSNSSEASILLEKFGNASINENFSIKAVDYLIELFNKWKLGENLRISDLSSDINEFTRLETARKLSNFISTL